MPWLPVATGHFFAHPGSCAAGPHRPAPPVGARWQFIAPVRGCRSLTSTTGHAQCRNPQGVVTNITAFSPKDGAQQFLLRWLVGSPWGHLATRCRRVPRKRRSGMMPISSSGRGSPHHVGDFPVTSSGAQLVWRAFDPYFLDMHRGVESSWTRRLTEPRNGVFVV